MKTEGTLSLVIMASGYGKRYGSNKLLEDFCGKPLFQYALEQAQASGADRIAVVTRFSEIISYVKEKYPSMKIIWNEHPERGISESLRLGLRSEKDSDGCCFMVSDQPLLRKESIRNLFRHFRKNPSGIYVCSHGKRRGNPVLFSKDFFEELMELKGDQGGKKVMQKYPDKVFGVFVQSEDELMDVDDRADRTLLENRRLLDKNKINEGMNQI